MDKKVLYKLVIEKNFKGYYWQISEKYEVLVGYMLRPWASSVSIRGKTDDHSFFETEIEARLDAIQYLTNLFYRERYDIEVTIKQLRGNGQLGQSSIIKEKS